MDRWFLRVLVPILLACAACGQPDAARTSEPEERPAAPVAPASPTKPANANAPRIVFLGDSLTAGYGLDKEESVPPLIEKRLSEAGYPYEVVNAGVSGDTSAGGLSRLDWSLAGDVKILVVELGANDRSEEHTSELQP